MNANVLGAIAVAAAVSLTGCGFKSDLFVPESKSMDELFTPDGQLEVQPEGQTEIQLPTVSTDIVTSDDILTDGVEVEGAEDVMTNTDSLSSEEGVPVDLDELIKLLERKRNAQ